jgi:hypothetical protein
VIDSSLRAKRGNLAVHNQSVGDCFVELIKAGLGAGVMIAASTAGNADRTGRIR